MEVKKISDAVKIMSVHMANLYYHLTKEVLSDFGDEAKKTFERAIINFGHERGAAIADKVISDGKELTIENLFAYYDIPMDEGWDTNRTLENEEAHNVTNNCTFAEVWKARNWNEIGHIYCIIDTALREGYSENITYIPIQNALMGDPCCESKTVYLNKAKTVLK